jgi:putative flippase GtrA
VTGTKRTDARPHPIRAIVNDQRIRYLATGGITAVVYYTIFSAGWLLLHGRIPYLAMAVIANLLTAVLTYPIYRVAVFRATGPWIAGFARFYAVFVWGLIFSLGGLPLLVEVLHMNVLVAQAIILVASPLINYQLHKLWAFRHRGDRPNPPEGTASQAEPAPASSASTSMSTRRP